MRCINIDWLECYCLESQPRDVEYFTSLGFQVEARDYGTRVYKEMFTIYDNGQPFVEVRRCPAAASSRSAAKFFDPRACHIRLCNRTCYCYNAGELLKGFLDAHGYVFMNLCRLDLAMDFEVFDSGDKPAKFLERYLKGRYSKVNQCTIAVHGKDEWDGRNYNSVSWGSKNSPIFTRFYDKTMELKEAHDKPYIRQAWARCGLVDDFIQLTKRGEDGAFYKPRIWRLEFAISSAVKNWVCFDVDTMGNKTHLSKRHNLDMYLNRDSLIPLYASLVNHYFHFKKYEEGVRKDRCEDKTLFNFQNKETYKVEKVAAAKADCGLLWTLKGRIENYRIAHYDESIRKACDVILQQIEKEILSKQASVPTDATEIELLRRMLAYNVSLREDEPKVFEREFYVNLMNLERDLFQGEKGGTIVPPSDFQTGTT